MSDMENEVVKMEETKEVKTNTIEINGEKLCLNKNFGPIGMWIYETAFKRSISDDIYNAINPVDPKLDSLLLYRLIYVMSGKNETMGFLDFLKEIPIKFNVLEKNTFILEKAQEAYLPF